MAFLNDGFKTLITIDLAPGLFLALREKEVTPAGLEGGGGIDTVTMRNTVMRTKRPKHLIGMNDLTLTASYDPIAYSVIGPLLINRIATITVTMPDGTLIAFFGWVDHFKPNGLKEGDFPLADVTIIPSLNNTGGSEAVPTLNGVAMFPLATLPPN